MAVNACLTARREEKDEPQLKLSPRTLDKKSGLWGGETFFFSPQIINNFLKEKNNYKLCLKADEST